MANKIYDDQKQGAKEDFDALMGRNFKPGEEDQMEAAAREGTKTDLKAAEEKPAEPANQPARTEKPELAGAEQESGLYNPAETKKKSKFRMTKKKGIITFAVGGVSVSIIAGLISLSSLLLPSLSFNMDNNRLARFTRNLMVNTDTITKLKLSLDSTGDAQYRDALRQFGGDLDGNSLWAKVNRLRPEKVAERLLLDVQFGYTDKQFVTVDGKTLTRRKVSSITYQTPDGPVTVNIPEHSTSFTDKIRHPISHINSFIDYRKQTRGLVNNLLDEATPDTSRLTRLFQAIAVKGKAASILRTNLDIVTWRWLKSEVDKANREGVEGDPTTEEIQRSYSQTSGDGQRPLVAASGDADATKAAVDTAACFKDAACTEQAVQQGDTIAPQARADLDNRFDPNNISNAVAGVATTVSSIVEIGNLACKMHQASIMSSGDIINANTGMALASYASLSAAGAQMVYTGLFPGDDRVNTEMLGGYNNQINGDVGSTEAGGAGRSNIMKIASGEPYDTADSLSPQASGVGIFATNPFNFLPGEMDTAFLALLGDPDALHAFPGIGTILALNNKNFCDVATNPTVQVVTAVVELGVALIPGVGQAIKGAGTAISKVAVWAVTKQVSKTIGRQFTLRNLAESGAYFAADNIISMIAMAHAVQRMGGLFNGAALGEVYLNQVDSGGETMGQELSRAYGGRPLTAQDYVATETTDNEFRVAALQSQSPYQRYFAVTNPGSLTNRLAVSGSSTALSLDLQSMVGNLSATAASLLNPARLLGWFGSIGNKTWAQGEEPSSEVLTRDYGITQFGWTEDELEATISNPEYSPLINEKELDDSGQRGAIAEKYGRCFDQNVQIGDMLAGNPESGQIFSILKGDLSGAYDKVPSIFRDNDANVIPNAGLCAPNNLGDTVPNDGKLTFQSAETQLVYRYRVSLMNHQTVDQMLEIQDPEPDTTVGGTSNPVTAEGYSFPLDPKKNYTNIPCYDISCHHDGSPAYDFGDTGNAQVYAISSGTIINVNPYPGSSPVPGCYSIQFHSDDTFYYWYGHLQNPKVRPGDRVSAGQQIAQVARDELGPRCHGRSDGDEPFAHLHIDRGCIINGVPQPGGRGPDSSSGECRDPRFVPFLTNLWLEQNRGS
ncbi:MAG: M23 family metallopeptidase [Candidatus Saccharimonadales bacterium]